MQRPFVVHYPASMPVTGARIGYTGWSSSPVYNPRHWLDWGYDGLDVFGHGALLHDPTASATVLIDDSAREVTLRDFRIQCGDPRGVLAGTDSASLAERTLLFNAYDCEIRGPGKWGVHGYQRGGTVERCHIHDITGEHGFYDHGYAMPGARFHGCVFERIEGEAIKNARRTTEVPWLGRAALEVAYCIFRDCGAGVVLQGAGTDTVIRDCLFVLGDHAVGTQFDAHGSWKLDQGEPATEGTHHSVGNLVMQNCLVYCTNPNRNALYVSDCESVLIRDSWFFGPGILQFSGNGSVTLERLNGPMPPAIADLAQRERINTSITPKILGQVGGKLEPRP